MSLTVAELESARADLVKARASGALSYTDQSGERIEYATDAQMRAKLAWLDAEISKLNGTAPPRVVHFQTSKGV